MQILQSFNSYWENDGRLLDLWSDRLPVFNRVSSIFTLQVQIKVALNDFDMFLSLKEATALLGYI